MLSFLLSYFSFPMLTGIFGGSKRKAAKPPEDEEEKDDFSYSSSMAPPMAASPRGAVGMLATSPGTPSKKA